MTEEMRSGEDGLVIDLSPGTFSMLAAMNQKRIVYRIDVAGQTVSGYEDVPVPRTLPTTLTPSFHSVPFRDADFRVAAVVLGLRVDGLSLPLPVLLGQTREGQSANAGQPGNRAAALGLGLFLVAMRLEPAAGVTDITLKLVSAGFLPAVGDAVLIKAALRNMLHNVIEYSTADPQVGVQAQIDRLMALNTLIDRDRGLSGLTHDRLKCRFRRGSNVADIAGFGLGRTTVEEPATAMGDSFDLSEREWGGAGARSSLPLA